MTPSREDSGVSRRWSIIYLLVAINAIVTIALIWLFSQVYA